MCVYDVCMCVCRIHTLFTVEMCVVCMCSVYNKEGFICGVHLPILKAIYHFQDLTERPHF